MVRGILADKNLEGHLRVLRHILEGPYWLEVWQHLNLAVFEFDDLGLDPTLSDARLWEKCQQEQLVLVTANRNAENEDSLEATLRNRNTVDSLPVLTLSAAANIFHSRTYAEQVAEKLLAYLLDVDQHRGAGRLYLP